MEIKLENYLSKDSAYGATYKKRGVIIPRIGRNESPEKRLELAQIALLSLIKASGVKGTTKSYLLRVLRSCKAIEINAALVALEKAGAIYGTITRINGDKPTLTLFVK